MPPQADEGPVFLIVAGPNGSGKSSAYREAAIDWQGRSVRIINPDLLAARIREHEHLDSLPANIEAVVRIQQWLETSIRTWQTVGVETVLSTDKYRSVVRLAKEHGFEVWLLYVVLDSPARNIGRVRLRVAKGGHAVPDDKIVERYSRSLQQLPWFLEQADRAWIFDNSGETPRLIAEKRRGAVRLSEDALPAIIEAVTMIR